MATVSFVQAATAQVSATAGNNISATFSVAPTQNNLLVAIIEAPVSSGMKTATGWVTTRPNGITNYYVMYKLAGASESTTQTPVTAVGTTHGSIAIWEVSLDTGFNSTKLSNYINQGPYIQTSAATITCTSYVPSGVMPPAGTGMLLMSATRANAATVSTAPAGFTQDGINAGAPSYYAGHLSAPPGTALTASIAWTGSDSSNGMLVTVLPVATLQPAVSIVQSAHFNGSVTSGGNITATLGATPTAGNLLIAFYGENSSTIAPTLQTGWVSVNSTSVSVTGYSVGAASHVVGAGGTGDTATPVPWVAGFTGSYALAVYEVSGFSVPLVNAALSGKVCKGTSSAGTPSFSCVAVQTGGNNQLLLGVSVPNVLTGATTSTVFTDYTQDYADTAAFPFIAVHANGTAQSTSSPGTFSGVWSAGTLSATAVVTLSAGVLVNLGGVEAPATSFFKTIEKAMTGVFAPAGLFGGSHTLFRSLTAGLANTGAFVKQTINPFTASMANVGTFTKKTTKALTATLANTSNFVKNTLVVPFAAGLANVAAFIGSHTYVENMVAGFAAAAAFIASPANVFLLFLTAAVAPTAATTKAVSRSLTAGLAPVASFLATHIHFSNLTAGFAAVGNATKSTQRAVTAGLANVGGFVKRATVVSVAGLRLTGGMTRQAGKALSAGITNTGAFVKRTGGVLAAGFAATGTYSKLIKNPFNAAFTSSGKIVTPLLKAFTAGFAAVGRVAKGTSQPFTASIGAVGGFVKRATVVSTAGLSFTGNYVRRAGKAVGGALTSAGSFVRATAYLMTARIAPTGVVQKRFGRALTAGIAATGAIARRITNTAFIAGLGVTGAIAKRAGKAVSGVFSSTGAFPFGRRLGLVFGAVLAPAAAIHKGITNVPFAAGIAAAAAFAKRTGVVVAGGIAPTGAPLQRAFQLVFNAVFKPAVGFGKRLSMILLGVVSLLTGTARFGSVNIRNNGNNINVTAVLITRIDVEATIIT